MCRSHAESVGLSSTSLRECIEQHTHKRAGPSFASLTADAEAEAEAEAEAPAPADVC